MGIAAYTMLHANSSRTQLLYKQLAITVHHAFPAAFVDPRW
jgi:hypothetical protein